MKNDSFLAARCKMMWFCRVHFMERNGPLLSSDLYNALGLLLIERHVIKLLCKLHQSLAPRLLLSPYAEVKEFIVQGIVGAVGGRTTGLVPGELTG